ncbi:oxidoreductase [Burkholderia cepacia]|uniref:SDR family NAD(P)-dependent oxidoreductase n=1 Tax=Burkholderia cepacia TaxID=292 RepID=UPI000752CE91|nr:SDR family NAD(P)-dependent oxidoreductase [Burkholderia cepacia]KWB20541.1 oxidoreductase [Burkholderia cepacia]
MTRKVWLVTGSVGGLGRAITLAALDAGHQVVATARHPDRLADLTRRYGAQILPQGLDVTDEAQGLAAVDAAVAAYGRLDVLVNNAGYADLRPFEQTPSEDFRQVVETCLFGVVSMTRAALPVMRFRQSGHIIQISSMGGRMAFPGSASYHAAKFAVGGFTDSVAAEVAPLGIVMTTLEPGGMRTNFGEAAEKTLTDVWPDYEASVGPVQKMLRQIRGHESGDPDKVAQLVLKLAQARRLPTRVVLGGDALPMVQQADSMRSQTDARWEEISRSIDVQSSGPIPTLPES